MTGARPFAALMIGALLATSAVNAQPPPSNDAFADAEVVKVPEVVNGSLVGATVEPSEEGLYACGSAAASVWYRVSVAMYAPVGVEMRGAIFGSLGVYRGTALGDLTLVDCFAPAGSVWFTAEPRETYFVRLSVRTLQEGRDFTLSFGFGSKWHVGAFFVFSSGASVLIEEDGGRVQTYVLPVAVGAGHNADDGTSVGVCVYSYVCGEIPPDYDVRTNTTGPGWLA